MKALGDTLSKVTRKISARQGFSEGRLLVQWALIVGPALAAYTCPTRIRYPDRNSPQGVLTVQVEGAWSLEVKHLEPVILERITAFMGYPAIARLNIRQVPLGTLARPADPVLGNEGKKNVAKAAQDSENLTLDDALSRLGHAIDCKPKTTR